MKHNQFNSSALTAIWKSSIDNITSDVIAFRDGIFRIQSGLDDVIKVDFLTMGFVSFFFFLISPFLSSMWGHSEEAGIYRLEDSHDQKPPTLVLLEFTL